MPAQSLKSFAKLLHVLAQLVRRAERPTRADERQDRQKQGDGDGEEERDDPDGDFDHRVLSATFAMASAAGESGHTGAGAAV